ncbi:hypothetical protein ABXN37_23950 [Piscinibacter sakaiensis]|uniref:hypothetical protein n=1 Tax=Piscinibacter sakaiensis TaxID=1547922 RepID=UPI0012F72F36|nr:hypothetical protein [Piscinibacter sakaiensis]
MAFFNFWKRGDSAGPKNPHRNLSITTGLRLEDVDVDVLFIARDGQVVFVNDKVEHLFEIDRDGDKKLNGRVVNIAFRSKDSVVETFVAFDDSDSYSMFTMGVGRQERLDLVARSIFQYFGRNSFHELFSSTAQYSTQYIYVFKLYQKGARYFMVNASQSAAYLIDGNRLKREGVDKLKSEFWDS